MANYRGTDYGRYWILKQRDNPWAMEHAPGSATSDLAAAKRDADLVTLATAHDQGGSIRDEHRECVYDFAKREIVYRGKFSPEQLTAYAAEHDATMARVEERSQAARDAYLARYGLLSL